MEEALRALRWLTTGGGDEALAFQAALQVQIEGARAKVETEQQHLEALDQKAQLEQEWFLSETQPDSVGGEVDGSGVSSSMLDEWLPTTNSDPRLWGQSSTAKSAPSAAELESEDESPESSDSPLSARRRVDTEVTELFTWGNAKNYQLGFGTLAQEQLVPRLISLPGVISVKSIACGRFHTVAVASCGSLFTWGFGSTTGRLGLLESSLLKSSSRSDDGAVFIVEPARLPEFGPGRHHAVKVAAGLSHTLALTGAGRMLAWGSNEHGQLGVQGIPVGEAARLDTPTILKGMRTEQVFDIAAGSAHSLCATASGGIFSWGSNARGALGVGMPPTAPALAPTPQPLTHLRSARALFTSSLGHVSAVLVATHGDPVVFGFGPTKGVAADSRCAVPSRVRRREGGSPIEQPGAEWQTARSGAGPSAGPAIEVIALGAEEGFAVDGSSCIWVWSLTAPRPCFAEPMAFNILPSSPSGPRGPKVEAAGPSVGLRQVAVADHLRSVWAVEDSASGCLWRLTKQQGSSKWSAKRYEHFAQAAQVACGLEHQAALVSFRRPKAALPPRSRSTVLVPEETPPAAPAAPQNPPSLQSICEDRFCQILSPRNFGLLCEIAWEFGRPELLDRAYAFLTANASLMFSRMHLPGLSQLPTEVLAALELAAAGSVAKPSEALALLLTLPRNALADPELMMHLPEVQALGLLPPPLESLCPPALAIVPEEPGEEPQETGKRRKKGAGSPHQSAWQTPVVGAAVSPTSGPGASPKVTGKASPALRPSGPSSSPLLGLVEWVEVKGRKKGAGQQAGQVGSPASKAAASPKQMASKPTSPGQNETPVIPQGSGSPAWARLLPAPATHLRLADFLRPDQKGFASAKGKVRPPATSGSLTKAPSQGPTSNGPSAMLAAAMQVAAGTVSADIKFPPRAAKSNEAVDAAPPDAAEGSAAVIAGKEGRSSPWAGPDVATEAPVSLRDILAEEKVAKEAAGDTSRTLTAAAAAEASRCSWGREAMPSAQPKGKSLYDLQKLEAEEQSKEKEETELQEIEAMFAALEVAERAEAEELLGKDKPAKEKQKPRTTNRRPKGDAKAGGGKGGGRDWSGAEWWQSWSSGASEKWSGDWSNSHSHGGYRERRGRGRPNTFVSGGDPTSDPTPARWVPRGDTAPVEDTAVA